MVILSITLTHVSSTKYFTDWFIRCIRVASFLFRYDATLLLSSPNSQQQSDNNFSHFPYSMDPTFESTATMSF